MRRRLVTITVDEGTPDLLHDELIFRDRALIARTTSGNFAFTLGRPIAMGYVANAGDIVDRDYVLDGTYEITSPVAASRPLPPPSALQSKGQRLHG